ncbi:alpha/beta-hydrolase [Crepidotus variabilis]|uniref:Alpha/beta-hydrolase n=1 Tax=Crepidotus variabilis TaxID=179855 RepID=A0A9P6JL08_9AGAR|nr:alpha/beta-hydrolase [Crepidotus variabilis]
MDPQAYQLLKPNRDLQYNVYYVKATSQTTTLLLLHGFPNSSYDWRYQVDFFTKLGYGVIVPDMLGYGGTDKPLDPTLYQSSALAQDIVDVVDQLKVQGPVVAIGHDWGSVIASRLANNHNDSFAGFGFVSVGYTPPNPAMTYEQFLAVTTSMFGRELFGYWDFFASKDAPEIIGQHYDAFWDCLFAQKPSAVKQISTKDGFRSYLPQKVPTALPSYLTQEEADITKQNFKNTGLKAPLNWYIVMMNDKLQQEDAAKIPKENYKVKKPTFFACCLNDAICLPALYETSMPPLVPQLTVHKYEAAHWVQWEKRDELNQDLKKWLEAL